MRVQYPIALDNDYAVWNAFANHYWPALYLTDAEGRIRHHWFGEGDYEGSEMVIQMLLAEAGHEQFERGLVDVEGKARRRPPTGTTCGPARPTSATDRRRVSLRPDGRRSIGARRTDFPTTSCSTSGGSPASGR
jgi:hypothetical protein